MTSKERIQKVFNFEKIDRVPTYDLLQNSLEDDYNFDFDIELLNDKNTCKTRIEEKFRMKACIGPFEDLSYTFGLERLLGSLAKNSKAVFNEFKKSTYKIIKRMEIDLKKQADIDGVWLWSDIAYKKGLFFSEGFYKDFLFPLHKEMCSFFKSHNLPVVLHSDGNLNSVIPHLIEAGFNGLHPVESSSGMSIEKLKNKYENEIVFIGGFKLDLLRYDSEIDMISDFEKKFNTAIEGNGYIFGFESPITKDIDIDRYKKILNIVREWQNKR